MRGTRTTPLMSVVVSKVHRLKGELTRIANECLVVPNKYYEIKKL
jgi:hypothetical protein